MLYLLSGHNVHVFIIATTCYYNNLHLELQELSDFMPVPGPESYMEMPAPPTPPTPREDLPDWGEWLASAQLGEEIDRLGRQGTRVYFKSKNSRYVITYAKINRCIYIYIYNSTNEV